MVVHACNLITCKAKTGIQARIQGQCSLVSEFQASLNYIMRSCLKKQNKTRCWWLTPIIIATQEAEIRRITV
jgi:hypothetical protein